MKKSFAAAMVLTLALLIAPIVLADVAIPTLTTVYFEMEGKPYENPVDYEVKCYGYTYNPGEDEIAPEGYDPENPELVYSYSASCPEYGCEINEGYYLNYRYIEYCDLEGESEGKTFTIENFASTPIPENCEMDGMERTCSATFEISEFDGESEAIFTDVQESNDFFNAIKYVKEQGIVRGYEDGSFKPESEINRAEFLKIIVEAAFEDSEINNCTPSKTYSDIPSGEWYEKYVCLATNRGIIQGYSDGTFLGDKKINFAESAKVIVLGFNFPTEISSLTDWYVPYVTELEDKNAIPVQITSLNKEILRGEMAEMIYRLKNNITDLPTPDVSLLMSGKNISSENLYSTDKFSVNYPEGWEIEYANNSGVMFIGNDSNSKPVLTFYTSPSWGMEGYEEYNREVYTNSSNENFNIVYYQVDEEFLNESPNAFYPANPYTLRFVIVYSDLIDETIFYNYDAEINVNAETQLKEVLDSVKRV